MCVYTIYAYICIYTHTCVCIHICVYIYIYIYTHISRCCHFGRDASWLVIVCCLCDPTDASGSIAPRARSLSKSRRKKQLPSLDRAYTTTTTTTTMTSSTTTTTTTITTSMFDLASSIAQPSDARRLTVGGTYYA